MEGRTNRTSLASVHLLAKFGVEHSVSISSQERGGERVSYVQESQLDSSASDCRKVLVVSSAWDSRLSSSLTMRWLENKTRRWGQITTTERRGNETLIS